MARELATPGDRRPRFESLQPTRSGAPLNDSNGHASIGQVDVDRADAVSTVIDGLARQRAAIALRAHKSKRLHDEVVREPWLSADLGTLRRIHAVSPPATSHQPPAVSRRPTTEDQCCRASRALARRQS